MIRGVLGSGRSIGGVLGSGRGGAAALWWLSGGVSAANCVAAYQPIGAASLAASYVNLANPGTYNAAPGTAPTFDTATGWTFSGSSQYLTTGITPANGDWSMIVRISGANITADRCIIGRYNSGAGDFSLWNVTASRAYYIHSTNLRASASSMANGILAMAGKNAYRDGVSEGVIGATAFVPSGEIWIGRNSGATPYWFNGTIVAVAIYNTTLTAPQVAAISAAMAAL